MSGWLTSLARRGAAVAVVLCLPMSVAACGSSDQSRTTSSQPTAATTASGDGATQAVGGVVADAQQALDAVSGPTGTFQPPPTGGSAPPKGKTIVLIPFAQSIPGFAAAVKDAKAAAQKLGWQVRVVDGKFSPNAWLAGVRDAVNAKADGVITMGPDCTAIKAALQEAKDANIPVVNIEGHDCDTFDPGAEPLFAATVGYQEGTLQEWLKTVGKLQADWVIAHTKGQAKVLDVFETDAQTLKIVHDAFTEELGKCSGCSIAETVEVTGADFGPKLQEKVQQALLKNPDVNVVFPSGTESLLPAGVAAAVRGSQNKPVSVGWECQDDSKANFQSGILGACLTYTPGWEAYAAVDALGSLIAGKTPRTETGIGVRLVDAEHNQDYVPYEAPVDYKSVYEKAWGLG